MEGGSVCENLGTRKAVLHVYKDILYQDGARYTQRRGQASVANGKDKYIILFWLTYGLMT